MHFLCWCILNPYALPVICFLAGNEVFKSCLIMKIAAAEYILSTMLLNHMYFISRKCESDPLDITDITEVWNIKVMIIQLPVSNVLSRRRHNFSSNIHLFRIQSFLKGRLSVFQRGRSQVRRSEWSYVVSYVVFDFQRCLRCILLMALRTSDYWELPIVTIYP